MTLIYPYNVPDWNKLRFRTPDAINADNVGVYAICIPRDVEYLVFGALSLLYEINQYEEVGITPSEVVDVAVNDVCIQAFCEAVLGCINDNEAVRDAIGALAVAANNPYRQGQNQKVTDGSLQDNLIDPSVACTYDAMYGQCLYVFNEMTQAVLDVLERIHATLTGTQLIIETVELIPGAELANALNPAVQAFDVGLAISDTLYTIFEAALTPAIVEQLACDLWCLCRDDCLINVDRIGTVIYDTVALQPPTDDLVAFFEWFLAEVDAVVGWGYKRVVAFGLSLLYEAWTHDSVFGDFINGLRTMRQVMQLGADETSNVWSSVCPTCPQSWCYSIDLSTYQQWQTNTLPVEVANGLQFNGGGCAQIIGCYWTLPELMDIERYEIDFAEVTAVKCDPTPYAFAAYKPDNTATLGVVPSDWGGLSNTTVSGEITLTGTERIRISSHTNSGTYYQIAAIRLYGSGTPPASANC